MKRYLINGLVLTAVMGCFTIAQERQAKPVTQASLARSMLTLGDKAEKAGLMQEATIILNAASEVMKAKRTRLAEVK